MNRREFIRNTTLAASSLMLASVARGADSGFPVVQAGRETKRKIQKALPSKKPSRTSSPPLATRNWRGCSEIVSQIRLIRLWILARWTASRTPMSSLNDIDAMWLRDSLSGMSSLYLSLVNEDEDLKQMIAGVINRQTRLRFARPLRKRLLQGRAQNQRMAQRFDRHETRRSRTQMGSRFVVLYHPPRAWILESHRRYRAF